MLKKTRQEILQEIEDKICNDLNNIVVEEMIPGRNYGYNSGWKYSDVDGGAWRARPLEPKHKADSYNNWANHDTHVYGDSPHNFCGPKGMEYWPPGMAEFIKRVALATAATIVMAIYSEPEAEAKIEKDLLGNNQES